ncbi:MAG: hypothetical protein U9O96_04165 [Candidatus Thermoplasmatota archaeon]|nr:hypothetical protein [Candidatus Thermoplasmatota archaeon]
MVSLTLSVPKEMKKEMEKFPEINWSAVARKAIKSKITILNEMDKILAESELTEKDAIKLGKKITRSVARKYGRN